MEARILGIELLKSIVAIRPVALEVEGVDGDELGEVDRTAVVLHLNAGIIIKNAVSAIEEILIEIAAETAVVVGNPRIVSAESKVRNNLLEGSDCMPVGIDGTAIAESTDELHGRDVVELILESKSPLLHVLIPVVLTALTETRELALLVKEHLPDDIDPGNDAIDDTADDGAEQPLGMLDLIENGSDTVGTLLDTLEDRSPDALLAPHDILDITAKEAPLSVSDIEGGRIEVVPGLAELTHYEVAGIVDILVGVGILGRNGIAVLIADIVTGLGINLVVNRVAKSVMGIENTGLNLGTLREGSPSISVRITVVEIVNVIRTKFVDLKAEEGTEVIGSSLNTG